MEKLTSRTVPCIDCGTPTPGPLHQRCLPCTVRLIEGRPLPQHALCAHCGEKRRAVLKWAPLADGPVLLCHNCVALVRRLGPGPWSRGSLLAALRRDTWSDAERAAYSAHLPLDETAALLEEVAGALDDLAASLLQEQP